jgi:alanine dehydrogenase
MFIGVPREIKNNENRVGITPAGVTSFVSQGHVVKIETGAGIGSGFTDEAYQQAGAEIVNTAQEAWDVAMVIKVKEVGTNAAKMAVGLGANVTIIDLNMDRLRQLDDIFQGRLKTLASNPYHISESVRKADLVIGAVLIPGSRAPRLVTEEMIQSMELGSVVVDVAIDQGGIIETIDHITTHSNPTYVKHGVVHYAVANMPGAVPQTSTLALTNVTIPYGIQIANKGYKQAALDHQALAAGINVLEGHVTHQGVAEAHGYSYVELSKLLASAYAEKVH